MTKRRSPEDSLQKQIAGLLDYQYPKVIWTHCPNGGSRNAIEATKLKAMGVKRGVPDILIFDHSGIFNGLAIELKIHPNKPTEEQTRFLISLMERGWRTKVCYSFDEAARLIKDYFKQPKTNSNENNH